MPADIAADMGILDLYDLCAEIGEKHGPERSRTVLFDGYDGDARQRESDCVVGQAFCQ
jgi:hypothetical protein